MFARCVSALSRLRPRTRVLASAFSVACAFTVFGLGLPGCGGGGGGPSGRDGGMDASAVCTSAAQCDDGVFCNGAERCAPTDPSADAQGCLGPAAPACMPDQTCDETASECLSECDVNADADGDGSRAMACGGDDCDDSDTASFSRCDGDLRYRESRRGLRPPHLRLP